MADETTFTAFVGKQRLATGPIDAVARALASAGAADGVLIFDDATGRPVELDLRFGPVEAAQEFRLRYAAPESPPPQRGRGRPRLGVVAREVTLLPRHWDWLGAQPGGASAALRRLVDEARRARADVDRLREARDATYRVMSALAGDLPDFEEAARALFAGDLERLQACQAQWPQDVRDYVMSLMEPGR